MTYPLSERDVRKRIKEMHHVAGDNCVLNLDQMVAYRPDENTPPKAYHVKMSNGEIFYVPIDSEAGRWCADIWQDKFGTK